MSEFNLRKYLGLYPQLCKSKFGRAYDFKQVESLFADVRAGEPLQPKHVTAVFDPQLTPFLKFWPAPDCGKLEELHNQPLVIEVRNKEQLLERMMGVFGWIDIVALLLRFAHPRDFAVYSIPVVNLLPLPQRSTAAHYLSYCDELAIWRDHFGLLSVAETDMALWAFHELALGSTRDKSVLFELRQFELDEWICRRRASCILRPLFDRKAPFHIARILLDSHTKLAGFLAGQEFERLVRLQARCRLKYLSPSIKLAQMLKELELSGLITDRELNELERVRGIRNKCTHPDEAEPDSATIEWMIKTIERLCLSWE